MLGLLDWGIGGLSVYRALRAQMPNINAVYLSDSGSIPYGKLSPSALAQRVEKAIHILIANGASHIIIACNAASTVLANIEYTVPVEGIIKHGIHAAKDTNGTLGIIGGIRTIRSGIYRKALQNQNRLIIQRIAQPLSAYIESGNIYSLDFQNDLIRICKPFKKADALLLACTHYPAISQQISQQLPNTKLIDPATPLAQWVYDNWRDSLCGKGNLLAMTTGNIDMMCKASSEVFNIKINKPNKIDL